MDSAKSTDFSWDMVWEFFLQRPVGHWGTSWDSISWGLASQISMEFLIFQGQKVDKRLYVWNTLWYLMIISFRRATEVQRVEVLIEIKTFPCIFLSTRSRACNQPNKRFLPKTTSILHLLCVYIFSW